MNVGNQDGEKFFLYFDSILKIEDVARKIYGLNKCKVLVPESQLSPCLEEKYEDDKFSKCKIQQLPGSQRSLNKNNQDKCKDGSPKITTSCKRKVSEASVLIPASARFSTRSPLVFLSTSTPSKGRFKLPLKMMSSVERSSSNAENGTRTKNLYQQLTENGQGCTSDNEFCETEQNTRKSKIREEAELPEKGVCSEGVLKLLPEAENGATEKQTSDDALDIVLDSQRAGRSNKSLLPGHLGSSSDKKRTWKKRVCSVPQKNITTGDRQKLNLPSGQASHTGLSERAMKHKAFGSIFGRASPDKQINKGKQQKNGTEITREENCKVLSAPETSLHSDFTKYNNTKEEADVLSRKETAGHEKLKMKIKSKEITDATKSLISKISDRYKDEKSKTRDSLVFNRPCSNKSCFSVSKESVQNRKLKTTTCHDTTADHSVYDVYNFNVSVFNEPTIKVGIQDHCVTEANTLTDPNKKENPGESKASSEMKAGKKARYNQNKKHLFSDTDTEYRGDDSKTDISWLQKSKAPSKPQIIDYSRNKNLGKSNRKGKNEFSDPPCQMDAPKGKRAKKKKPTECKKQSSVIDEIMEQSTRPKRPQRAVQPKNYKDPSSSESESEYSACTYKREKSKVQKCVNEKNKDGNHQKDLQNLVEPKTVATCVNKAFIKSKNSTEQKEIEMSSPESPESLETMRCAERISEECVTQDHTSSEGSPGLQKSTPEKNETSNFEKGISPSNLCLQKKNTQNMYLNQSPEMSVKKLTFGNKSFSPVLTASYLLNLSSVTPHETYCEKNTEGSVSETHDADENLSFRHGFSDKISTEGKQQDITKPVIRNKGEELSPVSLSSESEVQSWNQEPCGPTHESGPTSHVFLKRKYQCDTESHSDEVETSKEEEKKRSRRTKLQPRKLFKTDEAVTYRGYENLSTVSVSDPAALDVDIWEPSCSTIDICQKLQKEYTKKIESRSRKMEHFAKQSLRAANQHLTTMNRQLLECRVKQLDRFHFVILQEIENFEKDSQSLNNMEKELLSFWKKHKHTLSTFMKSEQQRLQILKTSFEKNIHHSVDCEENIFTSEVHLMKEDMKGLQEKFLKEMQEEELINVRRGLQTLFLAEDGKF
eukprot:XP_015152157.2 synaptonemal complex protein 2 [Gallus gallus]